MRFISFLLKCLFLSSLLYMVNPIGKLAILFFLIMITILFLIFKSDKLYLDIKIIILIFMFFCSGLIASFVNQDYELLFGVCLMLLFFFSLVIFIPSSVGVQNSNNLVYYAILWTHIPIIFIPLVKGGISIPYMGVFNNGNSFGITTVMVFSLFMSRLLRIIDDFIFSKKTSELKFNIIFTIMMLAILFILGIYSGSRTSTITNIVLIIFAVLLLIYKILMKLDKRAIFKFFRLTIFMSLLSIIVISTTSIKDLFFDIFINKFIIKIEQGNILSERGYIWRTTIIDARIFGNGRNYFTDVIEIGAHNTFISLLGQYGWVTLASFLFLIIIAFRYAISYSVRAVDDKHRYLPIMICISFIFLSFGESMMLKANMIGIFTCLGATSLYYLKNNKLNHKIENV